MNRMVEADGTGRDVVASGNLEVAGSDDRRPARCREAIGSGVQRGESRILVVPTIAYKDAIVSRPLR